MTFSDQRRAGEPLNSSRSIVALMIEGKRLLPFPLTTRQEIRSGSLSYAVIRLSMGCLQGVPYTRTVAHLRMNEGQLNMFAHREWTFRSPQRSPHSFIFQFPISRCVYLPRRAEVNEASRSLAKRNARIHAMIFLGQAATAR
jgi:hypothetical protein